MITIGEQIRKLRKQNGLSQDELGYKIGVSRQAVSQWETNALTPRSDKIMAMCELFNVSADLFLQGGENAQSETAATAQPDKKRKTVPWLTATLTGFFSALILSIIICLCLYIYPREGDETVASVDFGLTNNAVAAVLIILAVLIVAVNIFLIVKLIRSVKLDKMQG